VPVLQDTPATDGIAAVADRQSVTAIRIEPVPFQLSGHTLLLHEHRLAYRAQQRLAVVPTHQTHGEITHPRSPLGRIQLWERL
jgi:hypothetical protein